MIVKKELEYSMGTFRIGAVCLNEDETWKDDKVKPIAAEDDFMLHFREKNSLGVHVGKKHFRSVEEAEAYIAMLVLNGFSTADL